MDDLFKELILAVQQSDKPLDEAWLVKLINKHNRRKPADQHIGKRDLLPYYLDVYRPQIGATEAIAAKRALTHEEEQRLLKLLQMKPRRTASGVATITVLTKPYPCSSNCIYCPSDIRMPKSYLASEPACQRAEMTFFDPYLQVRSRLAALDAMGHPTDKIELIILGGSWNDYPESYQIWFMRELFRALNENERSSKKSIAQKRELYQAFESIDSNKAQRQVSYTEANSKSLQARINAGELSYNQAHELFYHNSAWQDIAELQCACWEELEREQTLNEQASHRSVGLCIETRPDLVSQRSALMMRRLGATKIQMGIQCLNEGILTANHRFISLNQIAQAFQDLRAVGFKIMAHAMTNLLEATPQSDAESYALLVKDERFKPDEIKLYPCVLVESADLYRNYQEKSWQPYTHDELTALLAHIISITPRYVRISRMIRDISSADIVAGNKKANLRQEIDELLEVNNISSQEIRQREIATSDIKIEELALQETRYKTSSTDEYFLEWVTPEDRIAGFLRLSLPDECEAAMIREVHIYGRVAGLDVEEQPTATSGTAENFGKLGGAQHQGLGRQLIEHACMKAHTAGYKSIKVISAVGTREYYRSLGFSDTDLYQERSL